MNKNNEDLILFLRNVIRDIEENDISDEQLSCVTQFYTSSLYEKELEENNEDNDISEYDVKKFISLGWYVYTHLLHNQIE